MQGAITTNSLHISLTLPRELNARRVKSKLQKYIFRSNVKCTLRNPCYVETKLETKLYETLQQSPYTSSHFFLSFANNWPSSLPRPL